MGKITFNVDNPARIAITLFQENTSFEGGYDMYLISMDATNGYVFSSYKIDNAEGIIGQRYSGATSPHSVLLVRIFTHYHSF
jgi:hypothetical protein